MHSASSYKEKKENGREQDCRFWRMEWAVPKGNKRNL